MLVKSLHQPVPALHQSGLSRLVCKYRYTVAVYHKPKGLFQFVGQMEYGKEFGEIFMPAAGAV
jgi:hypothetical protein